MREPTSNTILRRATVLFFILLLSKVSLLAQYDTIWFEDFDDASGLNTDWFIDTTQCNLDSTGGHFEVNLSSETFSACTLDSIGYWKTKNFYIGDKSSVGIYFDVTSGEKITDEDTLKIFYSIDNNDSVLLNNGIVSSPPGTKEIYSCYGEGISGDSIKLIVQVYNAIIFALWDTFRFDNVLIFSENQINVTGADTVCPGSNEMYYIDESDGHTYWWDPDIGAIPGDNPNDTVFIDWQTATGDGSLIVYDTTTLGCSSSDTIAIRIEDTEFPTLTKLPNDTLYINDSCWIFMPNYLDSANVADNCGALFLQTQSPSSGFKKSTSSLYNHGSTVQVILTLLDNSFHETKDTINVLILDTIPPDITYLDSDPKIVSTSSSSCESPPTNINGFDIGECSDFSIDYTMSGVTNGTGTGYVMNQVFNIGTTNIKYVFTDAAGNKDSISINILVKDDKPPSITVPIDTIVKSDISDCSAVVNNIDILEASDNCTDSVSLSFKYILSSDLNDTIVGFASGTTFDFGTTIVTYLVSDAVGNITSNSFKVTVNDSTPPNISLQGGDTIFWQNDANECFSSIDVTTATTNDICDGSPTISGVRGDGQSLTDNYPVGTTKITWTAADDSGNDSIADQYVIVSDTSRPKLSPISDIILPSKENSCDTLVTFPSTLFNIDENCNIDSTWNNITNSTDTTITFSVGTTEVWWYVEDLAGNKDSTKLNVTINDIYKPSFTPPSDTIINFGTSTDTVDLEYPLNLADNCSDPADIIINHTDAFVSGTCPVIDTIKRTWHVIDESLNDSIWIQNIIRIDTSAPDLSTQNITITLPESTGTNSISYTDIDLGTTDSSSFTMWVSDSTFDCSYIGDTTIIFYAQDHCGNIDSTEITITVEYETDPQTYILPQSDTICSGDATSILLDGNIPMDFFWGTSSIGVTGALAGADTSGNYITRTLTNPNDNVGYTEYIITPRIYETCILSDLKDTITIWVNPFPVVNPTYTIDTICNGEYANIKLETPTSPTDSIRFDVIVLDPSNMVEGHMDITRLKPNENIYQALTNTSNNIRYIDYVITPYLLDNGGNEICKNTNNNDTVRIYINPTPDLDVELLTPDTICNQGAININVTKLNLNIGGDAYYTLDIDTISGTINGIKADGDYTLDDVINDTPKNLTDSAQVITYKFTPWFDNTESGTESCAGTEDTTITIYLEPTPHVIVNPSTDTICNSEEVTISLSSNTKPTLPIRIDYESIVPAGVSLTNSSATGLSTSDDIVTEVINNTDEIKLVRLIAKPYTTTSDGSTLHCSGVNDTAYIWVEPTAMVIASPQEDTICGGDNISIRLDSDSNPALPVKFRYTTVIPVDVTVSPATGSNISNGDILTNQINNNSNTAQIVQFIISPYTTENNGTTEKCSGINDTVSIWIEPVTQVTASPQQDTICNGENVAIELNSPSTPTLPVKFKYTTQVPAGVTITPTSGSNLANNATLTNQINNTTNEAKLVTFFITPYSTEDDGMSVKCEGIRDTAYVWVEPTTNISVSPKQDTICSGENISVNLSSTSIPTLPVKFKYSSITPAGVTVTPNSETGLANSTTLTNLITNDTDEAQLVQFIVTPYSTETDGTSEKCTGINDTIFIWVEPIVNVTASPQQDTICDGDNISIELNSSSNPTLPVKFKYSTIIPAGVIVTPANGTGLTNNTTLTNQIDNNTGEAQLVQFIITPYSTETNGTSEKCTGINDTAFIWINPTPGIEISNIIPDTIICDNSELIIQVNSLNGTIIGDKKYNLTTSYVVGTVSGVQESNSYDITNVTDTLVNLTDSVQIITYQFEAVFDNVSSSHNSCGNGTISTVTIYLNPTPKLNVSVPDTLFCDLDEVQFDLNSLNGKVLGNKIFTLETNYVSGAIDGVQNDADYNFSPTNTFSFSDDLDNLTDSFQIVEYTFKARIKNPRTGLTYCDNGMDTTIRIYINPTPTIDIQINDTVYCDNSSITFNVNNTTGNIIGELYYYLGTNFNSDSVSNTAVEDHYLSTHNLTDDLTNNSFEYQVINYYFTPKIKDTRPGKGDMKCGGEETTVDIYLNPTPRISIAVVDTIYCNESTVEFLVNSVTTKVLGTLEFDIDAVASGTISGSSNGTTDHTLSNFSDILNNETSLLHYIDYTVTPKINNVPSSTPTCNNGITATVRVYITPTFETEAISLTRGPSIIGGWDVKCFGQSTAQASVNTTGGYVSVSGYTEDDVTYEWAKDGGGSYNTKTITGLTAGIYNVTATDEIGCIAESSIELKEPDLLEVQINIIENLACEGDEDGAMEAIINGGTEGYDITWVRQGTSSQTWETQYIENLIEGPYDLTIIDTNQCVAFTNTLLAATSSVQVQTRNPDVFKGFTPPSLNGYHIACYGGTMDSTIFIGKGDYSYNLIYPDGDTLNFETDITTVKNLPAGYYELIATDVNNCQSVDTFSLREPEPINIGNADISSYDIFNISCYGEKDGYIHLSNITGGIDYSENTYIYEWENPEYDSLSQYEAGIIQNKAFQDNLISGTYYVTIINGICEFTDTFELNEPEEMQINATIKSYSGGFNISCEGNSDGEISVNVRGGYIPDGSYTYNWSTGDNDSIVTGLSAKSYSLVVEDDISCQTERSFNLTQPDILDINYTISDYSGYNIRCYGGKSGNIELTPSGGDNTSYNYLWKTLSEEATGISETSKDQTNITAGNYRVIVSDGNSCIDSSTIELIEPEQLTILDIEKQNVSCDGRIKGYAEVFTSGGAGENTYLWSNGETTQRIENLNALFFTITVTDKNECQTLGSVQVEKTDSLNIELIPVEQYSGEVISCYGNNDGEILAYVSYGQQPYTYMWNTGDTDSSITNLGQGRYDVTITDILQCQGTQTIYINQPSVINVDISTSNVSCFSYSDGLVSLNTYGGTGPYTFNWINNITNTIPNYSGLNAGNYNVTIYDANNCSKDTLFTIEQPTALSLDYEIEKPFCPDMKDGSIYATASGGTPGYNYNWYNGSTSDYLNDLDENDYILTITDANQCELTDTVNLQSDARDCLDIPTAFTPNGDGFNDTWEIVVSSDKYPELPKVGDIYPDVIVEIYNRWGELIFVSENGYVNEWDGKNMKNGKSLPVDSYHYIIDFGDGRARTGNVTIIR